MVIPPKEAITGIVAGGLLLAGIHLVKQRKRSSSSIRTIPYQDGGETQLSAKAGDRFRVTWPSDSPRRYMTQPTEVTEVEGTTPTSIIYRVTRTMDPGGVDQVFVIVTDPNDEAQTPLGQHKITITAPE